METKLRGVENQEEDTHPRRYRFTNKSPDREIHEILGMENPDPKPTIEQVEIPNIPLANQPSVCIPPSTNRNLRNIQLADLDMAQEQFNA